MTNKEEIKQIVTENPEYREKLFIRGFYFTDDDVKVNDYPFYNNWNHEKIDEYKGFRCP